LCGEQTDENPHGSTGASNDGPRLVQPRARRKAPSNPPYQTTKDLGASWGFFVYAVNRRTRTLTVRPRARRKAPSNPPLPDNEGPWRKLGLFRLCGEQTDENPNGSTGASNAGEGTSERSDDDPSTGLALGRVAKR